MPDTADVVGITLAIVVRVAVVQVHVPGILGIIRVGSRRPIVVVSRRFTPSPILAKIRYNKLIRADRRLRLLIIALLIIISGNGAG